MEFPASPPFPTMQIVKQLLIQIEDELAAKLENVAPGHARRSEFVRNAIRQALSDLEEVATAAAYREHPDSAADAYLDPVVWESPLRHRRSRR